MKVAVRTLPSFRSNSASNQNQHVSRVAHTAVSRTSCSYIGRKLPFDARNASSQKFQDVIKDEELQKFEKELLGAAR